MGELWLADQGARLSVEHHRLIVTKQQERLAECPISQVERVVILGNVEFTTPTLKRLLRRGIALVLLGIDGQYQGRLTGRATPHVALRRQQYHCQGDPAFVLAMAQSFVAAKLQNLRVLLQRHRRNGRPLPEDVIGALATYQQRVPRTRTLHALRGLEGRATACYFSAYRTLFQPPWHMACRQRRPPTDPINVLLSLGYTLLTHQAESAIEATGLDPYAGFLHQDKYNRPSLALDLVEEFRPVIDGLVLHVCHHGIIKPEDFRPGEGEERPLVMEREALKCFVVAYQERFARLILHPRTKERLPLWRFLHVQAQEIARCIRQDEPTYRACIFR